MTEWRGDPAELVKRVNFGEAADEDSTEYCHEADDQQAFARLDGVGCRGLADCDGLSNQSVYRTLATHDGTDVPGSADGRAGLLSSAARSKDEAVDGSARSSR